MEKCFSSAIFWYIPVHGFEVYVNQREFKKPIWKQGHLCEVTELLYKRSSYSGIEVVIYILNRHHFSNCNDLTRLPRVDVQMLSFLHLNVLVLRKTLQSQIAGLGPDWIDLEPETSDIHVCKFPAKPQFNLAPITHMSSKAQAQWPTSSTGCRGRGQLCMSITVWRYKALSITVILCAVKIRFNYQADPGADHILQ